MARAFSARVAGALGYLEPIKLKYLGNNATGGPHSIQTVVLYTNALQSDARAKACND